jgi:hypothetical protein
VRLLNGAGVAADVASAGSTVASGVRP